jgi:hypothetical protein
MCRHDWDFVNAWLGGNDTERLTQGLLSLVLAVVFLFALGPLAIGLMLISVALATLAMLLPVSLLLFAAGLDQGKKLLKLTGAAAGGKFIFTLALTFLTLLISMTYAVVQKTIATDTPNLFEQVLEGAAPLAALYLFKKLSKALGFGDIGSMTGGLAFAGAAALKATGDRDLSRGAAERMSGAIGRIGVGNKRLSALDETSLQRRMLNNGATRAVGRGAKRVARPATAWAADRYGSGRAAALRRKNALLWSVTGAPRRALTYTGTGLTAVAGRVGAFAAPAAKKLGFNFDGVKDRRRRGGDGGGGLKEGDMINTPMTSNTQTADRRAKNHHRNIIRVNDRDMRSTLTTEYVHDGLNMLRARQLGGKHTGGLNLQFKAFANDQEKKKALEELSKSTELSKNQLMLGDQGLWAPVPVTIDKRTGQRVFAPGSTIEQASHPVHYLDRYTLQRQIVDGAQENDDQYIARLTAQLRERGYITDRGEVVDVFAANGFDTRIPEVRERVAAFISGVRDEELSKIIVKARRSEDVAVRASRKWVDAQE